MSPGEARLWSRNGKDFTAKFPDIQSALAAQVGTDCVLDGELVVWTGERMDFDALQQRMVNTTATVRRRLAPTQPASLVVFDLLAVGNVDVRPMRWTLRRNRLETLAKAWRPPLQLSPVTADVAEAREWLAAFKASGVEGLVVKGATTRYQPGRREWVKVNSVGVVVFDELTRGTCDQVSMVRGELACERHLSDTLPTAICCHAARVTCASSRWRRDGRRGPRHALTEVPELDHRDRPRRGP